MEFTNGKRLTNEEKKEIILYLEQNKFEKYTIVAKKFANKFKKSISAKSIGNYFSSKEQILMDAAINSSLKRTVKSSKYQKINTRLFEWIQTVESFSAIYNEKIIKVKAIEIAKTLNLTEFKPTNEWLQSFKSVNGICSKVLSGESSNLTKENFMDYKH